MYDIHTHEGEKIIPPKKYTYTMLLTKTHNDPQALTHTYNQGWVIRTFETSHTY